MDIVPVATGDRQMCIPSRSREAVIRASRDSFCLIHTWVQLSIKQLIPDFIFVLLSSSLSPPAQLTQPTEHLLPVSGGSSSLNNRGCLVCLPSTHEGHLCLSVSTLHAFPNPLLLGTENFQWKFSPPAENSLGVIQWRRIVGRRSKLETWRFWALRILSWWRHSLAHLLWH